MKMSVGIGMDLNDWGLPLSARIIQNYFIVNILCIHVIVKISEE